jgi:hypothetical protein
MRIFYSHWICIQEFPGLNLIWGFCGFIQGQCVHLATTAAFPFIFQIVPFNLTIRSFRYNHLREGTHKHLQAHISPVKETNVFPLVYRFTDNTVK